MAEKKEKLTPTPPTLRILDEVFELFPVLTNWEWPAELLITLVNYDIIGGLYQDEKFELQIIEESLIN